MARTKYRVLTYDINLGDYTQQRGVRCGPYTLFGLRRALRALRDMGYECGRQDPAVYVERYDYEEHIRRLLESFYAKQRGSVSGGQRQGEAAAEDGPPPAVGERGSPG